MNQFSVKTWILCGFKVSIADKETRPIDTMRIPISLLIRRFHIHSNRLAAAQHRKDSEFSTATLKHSRRLLEDVTIEEEHLAKVRAALIESLAQKNWLSWSPECLSTTLTELSAQLFALVSIGPNGRLMGTEPLRDFNDFLTHVLQQAFVRTATPDGHISNEQWTAWVTACLNLFIRTAYLLLYVHRNLSGYHTVASVLQSTSESHPSEWAVLPSKAKALWTHLRYFLTDSWKENSLLTRDMLKHHQRRNDMTLVPHLTPFLAEEDRIFRSYVMHHSAGVGILLLSETGRECLEYLLNLVQTCQGQATLTTTLPPLESSAGTPTRPQGSKPPQMPRYDGVLPEPPSNLLKMGVANPHCQHWLLTRFFPSASET